MQDVAEPDLSLSQGKSPCLFSTQAELGRSEKSSYESKLTVSLIVESGLSKTQ